VNTMAPVLLRRLPLLRFMTSRTLFSPSSFRLHSSSSLPLSTLSKPRQLFFSISLFFHDLMQPFWKILSFLLMGWFFCLKNVIFLVFVLSEVVGDTVFLVNWLKIERKKGLFICVCRRCFWWFCFFFSGGEFL